ncbi:hypothetical protein E2C01_047420 [Portunus trituberculatus]|uniref:Uncharacterized protein n=1 Tax=Portunus trituberculatus TaxID=210409 RepID=A0A5B7G7V4_PORTR|nr:hypothetical protein [Portunus trituberculatus]
MRPSTEGVKKKSGRKYYSKIKSNKIKHHHYHHHHHHHKPAPLARPRSFRSGSRYRRTGDPRGVNNEAGTKPQPFTHYRH